jgi:hydroxyacylglutathione hydrolase
MRVLPIPCLSDNYAYLVAAESSNEAVVIDPSEASPVIAALEREGLKLVAILNTHHHWDHVGGNDELLARFGALPVYAHASDLGRVPKQTERVEEGNSFKIAGISFRPLHVPGHTLGAVSYCSGEGADHVVFTGDTLFVAGCGRLFEGTPEQMFASLAGKLGKLAPETRVFCGHEYALNNLRFALHVEPENEAVKKKLDAATEAKSRGGFMIPSTIGEELATNPFLRCEQPSVRERFPGATPAAVLGAVRKAKDNFR